MTRLAYLSSLFRNNSSNSSCSNGTQLSLGDFNSSNNLAALLRPASLTQSLLQETPAARIVPRFFNSSNSGNNSSSNNADARRLQSNDNNNNNNKPATPDMLLAAAAPLEGTRPQ
jgi:hypothetical protein